MCSRVALEQARTGVPHGAYPSAPSPPLLHLIGPFQRRQPPHNHGRLSICVYWCVLVCTGVCVGVCVSVWGCRCDAGSGSGLACAGGISLPSPLSAPLALPGATLAICQRPGTFVLPVMSDLGTSLRTCSRRACVCGAGQANGAKRRRTWRQPQ